MAIKEHWTMKSFKILVIGEGAVGKTSIATRYTTGAYKESHLMTLGANFMLKDIKMGDRKIRLSIWDTAGQEKFRKIVETYYAKAHGIVLVFDLNQKRTFDELEYWLGVAKEKVPDAKKILVGNKLDLADVSREVETASAQTYADEHGMPYFESSAKLNANISEVFGKMAELVMSD